MRYKVKIKFLKKVCFLSQNVNLCEKHFSNFLFFKSFFLVLNWNFNVICQYFKCKAYVSIFFCSNALEMIGKEFHMALQQENKFLGNIFNFSWMFCLILKKNYFDFWKSPNKKYKCSNLWQKTKCASYRKQTFFFLIWSSLN